MGRRVLNEFPVVPTSPKIAIIGEAPGAEEESVGRPFVGYSGQMLNAILNECKIMRAGCFVGNVFQYKPLGNDISTVDKNSPVWHECCDQLKADLEKFKPDLIIALGETALNYLTGRNGITKWRGSIILDAPLGRVIPSYHPAAILRQWSWRPVLKFDIAKAKYESQNLLPLPAREFNISPTLEEIRSFIHSVHKAEKPTAFDIETVHHQITCLGLCNTPQYALVIPFDNRWSVEEEGEIWWELARLFERTNVPFVAQNAQYDMGVLKWFYNIRVQNLLMDTMLAHHACYPELPKSLAFLASIYTREPYYKHESKEAEGNEQAWSDKVPKEQLYRYNAKDCCVTLECHYRLKAELERHKAEGGYKIDMESLPIALEMTLRGINIDSDQCSKRINALDSEIAALGVQITNHFGCEVNTKSPKQMKELLYVKLGYEEVTKKGGKVTTDADALIKLARKYNSVELKLLLKQRQLRTKRSFFEPVCYTDGRFHAGFNVCGTETGRWSSSGSFLGARNLMNIPDDCRDIYRADPGYTLIGWDKSQAEARVVAYEGYLNTGDSTYKDLIESGKKPHLWFGDRLTNIRHICPMDWDDLLKNYKDPHHPASAWYLIFKKSIHGFSYDLGPIKWCDVIATETDGDVIVATHVAKAIKDALYIDLPTIPRRQAAIQQYLFKSRKMTNPFGRVRHFFGRGDDLYGEAYANIPQGTVADDVACSIQRIAQRLPYFEILQQNYDSMFGQCPTSLVSEALPIIKECAEQPITLWDFYYTKSVKFTIPIELKVGPNWQDLEEVK